jgi:hypothetical protein
MMSPISTSSVILVGPDEKVSCNSLLVKVCQQSTQPFIKYGKSFAPPPETKTPPSSSKHGIDTLPMSSHKLKWAVTCGLDIELRRENGNNVPL